MSSEDLDGDRPTASIVRGSRVVETCRRALDRLEDRLGRVARPSRTWAVLARARAVAARSRLGQWVTSPPPALAVDVDDHRALAAGLAAPRQAGRALGAAWRASATRRGWRALVTGLAARPVRILSAVVLVAVAVSVFLTWGRATSVGLGAASILSGLALLGLEDERSWRQLREGRAVGGLLALFEPPEDGG